MERSPVPTTFEVLDEPVSPTVEKQSFISRIVFSLRRYFADKLAPYQTPPVLQFPPGDPLPERSHQDSLIAKVGYTINDLQPESMTDRELVAWVARYLGCEVEPISGDRTSDKSKLDFIIQTMHDSSPKFSHNLESAVFNLLRTISHQQKLSPEVAGLRRNLKALARKANFKSCQSFFPKKAKQTKSA